MVVDWYSVFEQIDWEGGAAEAFLKRGLYTGNFEVDVAVHELRTAFHRLLDLLDSHGYEEYLSK